MDNKTALKAEFKQKTIEGRIRGLADRLYKMAPHSDMSRQRGPLFISLDTAFKPAAEYDGMLGSLALDSVLGLTFADAAINDNSSLCSAFTNMNSLEVSMEATSEYLKDKDKRAHGQGSFARGTHAKTVMEAADHDEDFGASLGEHLEIEETLAQLSQSLSALKRTDLQPATLEFCV